MTVPMLTSSKGMFPERAWHETRVFVLVHVSFGAGDDVPRNQADAQMRPSSTVMFAGFAGTNFGSTVAIVLPSALCGGHR